MSGGGRRTCAGGSRAIAHEERTDDPTGMVLALAGRLGQVPELEVRRPSLEDVYLSMIADAGLAAAPSRRGRVGAMSDVKTSRSVAALGLSRTRIELLQFRRETQALIFIFFFPVVMLVIFASVFNRSDFIESNGVGITGAQYYVTGMIATGVMLSSFQALSIAIAVERDNGTLKLLHGTPDAGDGLLHRQGRPGGGHHGRPDRLPARGGQPGVRRLAARLGRRLGPPGRPGGAGRGGRARRWASRSRPSPAPAGRPPTW